MILVWLTYSTNAKTYPWYSPKLINCNSKPFRIGYDLPYPKCRFIGRVLK
jgi:hypothetical protein